MGSSCCRGDGQTATTSRDRTRSLRPAEEPMRDIPQRLSVVGSCTEPAGSQGMKGGGAAQERDHQPPHLDISPVIGQIPAGKL